jgi:hypothetical protein
VVPGGVVFVELAGALRPYLGDVVFVGGWVHALYLIEAEGHDTKIVRTYDIDITLPRTLDASSRPPLIDLVRDAGFRVSRIDAASGLLEIANRIEIRVPTLSAYALGKVLSSSARARETKQAKDLVYLEQLLVRRSLREELDGALPALLARYPEESQVAEEYLRGVLASGQLLREVARQEVEASGFGIHDDTPVRQQLTARLRRFVGDTWGRRG